MLSASTSAICGDSLAYGEDAAASWILTCSEDELVRVCSVADWLLYYGPATASGSSMLPGKACALAAVYVQEGRPRKLARNRRSARALHRGDDATPGRQPNCVLQQEAPP